MALCVDASEISGEEEETLQVDGKMQSKMDSVYIIISSVADTHSANNISVCFPFLLLFGPTNAKMKYKFYEPQNKHSQLRDWL